MMCRHKRLLNWLNLFNDEDFDNYYINIRSKGNKTSQTHFISISLCNSLFDFSSGFLQSSRTPTPEVNGVVPQMKIRKHLKT